MSEALEWSEMTDNHRWYRAMGDGGHYIIRKTFEGKWRVTLSVHHPDYTFTSPERPSPKTEARSAPTLEDAKQIAEQWELERKLR
jgi:hypothetical protein